MGHINNNDQQQQQQQTPRTQPTQISHENLSEELKNTSRKNKQHPTPKRVHFDRAGDNDQQQQQQTSETQPTQISDENLLQELKQMSRTALETEDYRETFNNYLKKKGSHAETADLVIQLFEAEAGRMKRIADDRDGTEMQSRRIRPGNPGPPISRRKSGLKRRIQAEYNELMEQSGNAEVSTEKLEEEINSLYEKMKNDAAHPEVGKTLAPIRRSDERAFEEQVKQIAKHINNSRHNTKGIQYKFEKWVFLHEKLPKKPPPVKPQAWYWSFLLWLRR
ncbi:hypothetical protein B7494_g7862 [Chlorociboria aeruginascens]|nr:hypothetical protein B7494_g7862 [Chlorociboria aeruginascens]